MKRKFRPRICSEADADKLLYSAIHIAIVVVGMVIFAALGGLDLA